MGRRLSERSKMTANPVFIRILHQRANNLTCLMRNVYLQPVSTNLSTVHRQNTQSIAKSGE